MPYKYVYTYKEIISEKNWIMLVNSLSSRRRWQSNPCKKRGSYTLNYGTKQAHAKASTLIIGTPKIGNKCEHPHGNAV